MNIQNIIKDEERSTQRHETIGCERMYSDGWMDGYFIYRRSTLKGHIASNKLYII